MATYVAGQNQLALLANAFSGAAKGAQDFAQLKMRRDQMAQQQAQFDANLDLGCNKLAHLNARKYSKLAQQGAPACRLLSSVGLEPLNSK